MVQWFALLVAVLVYEDERKHREWQRKQGE